jgi:hypothetical protein
MPIQKRGENVSIPAMMHRIEAIPNMIPKTSFNSNLPCLGV